METSWMPRLPDNDSDTTAGRRHAHPSSFSNGDKIRIRIGLQPYRQRLNHDRLQPMGIYYGFLSRTVSRAVFIKNAKAPSVIFTQLPRTTIRRADLTQHSVPRTSGRFPPTNRRK